MKIIEIHSFHHLKIGDQEIIFDEFDQKFVEDEKEKANIIKNPKQVLNNKEYRLIEREIKAF